MSGDLQRAEIVYVAAGGGGGFELANNESLSGSGFRTRYFNSCFMMSRLSDTYEPLNVAYPAPAENP